MKWTSSTLGSKRDPQENQLFRPDFVHIHYDDWIVLYPYVQYPLCVYHPLCLHRAPRQNEWVWADLCHFQKVRRISAYLKESRERMSILGGIPADRLWINPNGVDLEFV